MELIVKAFDELSARELHDILRLRTDVFVVEQECAYPEVDGLDLEAVHAWLLDSGGATDGAESAPYGGIAAYIRVLPLHGEEGVAKIGRVVTARRGEGLGRRILEAAMDIARERLGAASAYLEAQVQAVGFYEGSGFAVTSEPFDDAGIMHVRMRREL